MSQLDSIQEDVREVRTGVQELRADMSEVKERLAVVETKAAWWAAIVAAIVGFFTGTLGKH